MGQQNLQCQHSSGCDVARCKGGLSHILPNGSRLPCEGQTMDLVERVRARGGDADVGFLAREDSSGLRVSMMHPRVYDESVFQTELGKTHGRRSPPIKRADFYCKEWDDVVESSALQLPTPRSRSDDVHPLKTSPQHSQTNGTSCQSYSWGDYSGGFANGKPNGYGKLARPDGKILEGQWVEGKLSGHGQMTWPDGTSYFGEFFNNCRNGDGVFKSASGVVYSGQFVDDKMDGHGVCTFTDGRVYDGAWEKGCIHGQGKMTWRNKSTYMGEYFLGRKHGNGIFMWPDGRTHAGLWKAGAKDGAGVATDNQGNATHGEWKNGRLKVASLIGEDDRNDVLCDPDVEIGSPSIFCRPSHE